MANWYLNRALTNFRNEVNARWPNRDKSSDGTIGDAKHQATNSDHNPDKDGSVDAWDMDVDGVDVWKCINAALKHESIQYVIYNRRITSRSWGLGVWRYYDGANPHDKHVHFNTRESHENSTKPWLPKEDTMNQAEFNTLLLNALRSDAIARQFRALPWQYIGGGIPEGMSALKVFNETYENSAKAAQPQEVKVAVDGKLLAAALMDPSFLAALAKAVNDDASKRMQA